MTNGHQQYNPQRVQRVLILGNDPFSRHWMAQLIMRDWRTQVIDSTASLDSGENLAVDLACQNLDAIVLDADALPMDFSSLMGTIHAENLSARLIVLSTQLIPAVLDHLNDELMGGYLIKGEVEVSLAWAVIEALQGVLVISKSVEQQLINQQSRLERACIVIDGIEAAEFLTPAENRNAWLAFVLSMARGNLADELMLSPGSSFTLVSNLYRCLGVNDLLNGDDWINLNIEEHPLFLAKLVVDADNNLKTDDKTTKETLAYHIYTKPKTHRFS